MFEEKKTVNGNRKLLALQGLIFSWLGPGVHCRPIYSTVIGLGVDPILAQRDAGPTLGQSIVFSGDTGIFTVDLGLLQ